MPNSAGSTATEITAASTTALIAPYATDFKNACGNISSPDSATPTMSAEKNTVLPAVLVVTATASSTSRPRSSSSRKRETMNRP